MDISSSLFQLQEDSEFLFDCKNFLEQSFCASDAGYYSACSSLSPASSTDSCCFSPPGQDAFPKLFPLKTNSDQEDKKDKMPKRTGRPRSKFPGVKRQNASEREKLRMRDLTKALHHLRNYLPPSVAPAGQMLTKIETLRLTINYINHLSAQLELGQEEASQANPLSPPVQAPDAQIFPANQVAPQTQSFNMSYQSPDNVSLPASVPLSQCQEYWIHQQQYCFYGQC